LPGCISQGDSLSDALENVREAIKGILEVRRKHHMPLQEEETPDLIAQEILQTLKARAEEGLPLLVETRVVEVEAAVAV
jgi:predicted RNase H-like HicB family nuclease